MKIHDKLKKPIKEARYLDVENTVRYRSIIRLFYLNYEKLKYWMYQEEVYEELTEDPYFSEYTIEQCQQDLDALKNWGNLATIQDTRKARSLAEFQKKRFRYQLTETAVEIERMVIRLENLFIEGSSLEPSLLERICMSFREMSDIREEDSEKIYAWWSGLNHDFVRLNQNYQDYMRELNSVKAEEMMRTREFLIFKDRLVEYLRSFVKSLQENVGIIEEYLRNISPELVEEILYQIVEYEFAIPRLDTDIQIQKEDIYERVKGRWMNMCNWFIGRDGLSSEALKVFDTTNEIIRKITRYATRLSERNNLGANRREEYRKLVRMFADCENIEEAHLLSSVVFGIEKPLHIKGDFSRRTDSIISGIFDENPVEIKLRPRIRNYREKVERSRIEDHSKEKEEVKERMIQKIQEEQKLLNSFIKDGRLDFSALPEITPEVRNVLLSWLSKGLESKVREAKTEDGRKYKIIMEHPGKTCIIRSYDGTFRMPAYVIVFEQEKR